MFSFINPIPYSGDIYNLNIISYKLFLPRFAILNVELNGDRNKGSYGRRKYK